MANTYFQFKQFRIEQDRCSMKVCTDACILGAWFAARIPSNLSPILDIGAGTGLQMLMLAQHSEADIHGIEIDPQAFSQLQENLAASPWKKQFTLYSGDVRTHPFPQPFAFIVSNPPFFEGDLPSSNKEKNLAKHSNSLSLQELLQTIDTCLKEDGSFGLLLPFHRLKEVVSAATARGFHLKETLVVKQTNLHAGFRVVVEFSRKQTAPMEEELIIKENNAYTTAFTSLLKEYYLAF